MASHVKNQHFVPRFLLKYFADDKNSVWCYDKQWKHVAKKGIGGIAFEKHFYDRTPGIKKDSLEYVYQRAETHTAPIIQRIITENSLRNITIDEKVALAVFIVMQLNRTQTAFREVEKFQKGFIGKIKEFVSATGAIFNFETRPAKDLWFSMLDNTPEFSEILLQKIWYLASSNNEFYTSDHPVVRGNYKNRAIGQVRGVLGLNSDGIEIYFPLTPSLLLCIRCERSYVLPNEDVVKYQALNIEYVNHLQVKQSNKFVFSSRNEFGLVEDMIQKKEV